MAKRGKRSSRNGVTNPRNDLRLLKDMTKQTIHRFARLRNVGDLAWTSADQGFGYSFALSDLPSATEFTALFDSYRIEQVDMIWHMNQQVAANIWPTIYIFSDLDDSAAPSTLDEVMQRDNCEVIQFAPNRLQFTRSVRPQFQLTASSASVGMVNPRLTWLDCATATIAHYGIRGWAKLYNNTLGPINVNITMRYHLAFRSAR